MKQKKEEKLRLGKITIADFETRVDSDDQKLIKGGSNTNPPGTTDLAIFC